MQDIEINLLRSFIILAETQNFTRTAERVHRSQSAVSMQIAKLEEILDCSLFDRDKRNVRLTIEGEKLRSYASQILTLSDSLIDRFDGSEVEGNINFGSPEDFATFYLPSILADFVKAYPRIMLNVNCELTLSLIKEFEKKRYDLIVIKQEPDKIYKNAITLWREQLVWAGGNVSDRDSSFKSIVKKHSRSCGVFPLVLSPPPCVYRQGALDALDKLSIRWKIVYTSPSFAGARAAVKAGLGYAVFPRKMIADELVVLEQSRGWPKLKDAEICLLAKSNLSPATETLVSFIRDRISY